MNVENIFVTSRAVGQERFLLFFHFLLDRRRSRDSKGSLRCNVQIFLFRPFFFSKQNFCRKFFSQTVLSLISSGGTGGTGVMLVLV